MYATALNVTITGELGPVHIRNTDSNRDVDITMNVSGISGVTSANQNVLDENNAEMQGHIFFNILTFPGINLPMKRTYMYGNDETTIDTNGSSLTVELFYSVSSSTAFRNIYVTAPACTLTLQITAIY